MPIQVTGLQGIILRTPDLKKSAAFYRDVWGLSEVASSDARCRYFGAGSDDWMLGLVEGPKTGLERLRLNVATPETVAAAAVDLSATGMEIVVPPGQLPGPGKRYGMVFRDPDEREVELGCSPVPPASQPLRADLPARLSHVVINSPQSEAVRDFYIARLGFTLSDWYEGNLLIFLRCNADHHCLAFGQSMSTAINHVAFLVDNVDAVMRAMSRVKAAGYSPVWGPGRHGPGGNVFCYFEDPSGVVVEYTAEVIQIDDDKAWMAKEWARTPDNANIWGTGGPTPRAIALMSATPPEAS